MSTGKSRRRRRKMDTHSARFRQLACGRLIGSLLVLVFAVLQIGCSSGSQPPPPSIPSITSISPNTTIAGGTAVTLTVIGENFTNSATVEFNGSSVSTTFNSVTQLTATVPAADIETAGIFAVNVSIPGVQLSNSVNFTADNPLPSLNSLSSALLASGSPATMITVNGSNFVSGSEVLVGGNGVQTKFISSAQLSATLPAAILANVGVLQVTVNNPSPGGGNSSSAQLSVVGVASFAILVVSQNAGVSNSPWSVAAAAVDSTGAPIVGLPVGFSSNAGTLANAAGTTDSIGAFSTTLTPPSGVNSAQVATISAVTGGQTATAVILFSSTSPPASNALPGSRENESKQGNRARLRAVASSDSSTTFSSYPFSLGGAPGPGAANTFANSSNPECYSNAVLSGEETTPAICLSVRPNDNATVVATSWQTEACQIAKAISDALGIGSCVGAAGIPVACALGIVPTGGADVLICGGFVSALEVSLAQGCAEFLVSLFAKSQLVNAALTEVDVADCTDGDISACVSAGLDIAGIYCTASTAPSSPGPICPPGTTCVYVTNSGSNTMSVFDTTGKALPIPSGAFPHLNVPDGLVYDPALGDLVVTNTGNRTVTIYDLSGNEVFIPGSFSNLSSSGDPEDITLDAFSGNFYINDATKSQIFVYDSNGSPITPATGAFPNISSPYGVVWNPANDTIYVSNDGTDTITAYNPSGKQVSLPGAFSGLAAPDDFIIDPANQSIYVTEAASGGLFGGCAISGIAEFDLNGNSITPSGGFKTVNCPDSIALLGTLGVGAPELLYITNIFGNSVTVYDQNGNDLTSQVAPGGFPGLNQPTGIIIVTTPQSSSAAATPKGELKALTQNTDIPGARPPHLEIGQASGGRGHEESGAIEKRVGSPQGLPFGDFALRGLKFGVIPIPISFFQ